MTNDKLKVLKAKLGVKALVCRVISVQGFRHVHHVSATIPHQSHVHTLYFQHERLPWNYELLMWQCLASLL